MDSSPLVSTGQPSHDPPPSSELARPTLLRVEAVSKRFGRLTAVDAIDLHVSAGESLALLGPNGAGKSTLMQLIAGVLQPDTGRVVLLGDKRGNGDGDPRRAAVRRALGFAPQALAVYPQLTARENVLFFARLYGVRAAVLEQRVKASLEIADLSSRAGDRAATFSGGMLRRLNLACAIVHEPKLLLLDEPTVGVDPHSRDHLLDAIAQLRQRGMALIYSTHLMEEGDRLCDRVAVLERGRVLVSGECRTLCQEYGVSGLAALFMHLTGKELRD